MVLMILWQARHCPFFAHRSRACETSGESQMLSDCVDKAPVLTLVSFWPTVGGTKCLSFEQSGHGRRERGGKGPGEENLPPFL